jgi:hypothetical protein
MKLKLFVLFLLISPTIFAQNWEQALSKDGITIWTRKISWSDYKEFKGETIINSNLENILSVFDDLSTYKDWVYNCISSEQIKRESLFRGTRYIAIKAPWPVKDRDVVFEYTVSQNKTTKVLTIKMIAIKGVVPDRGRVRMTFMIGSYEFTPIAKNKTKVVYLSHNDPAGSVPTAIINKTITDTPYYTLFNLKNVIASGKFKKQTHKEILEY